MKRILQIIRLYAPSALALVLFCSALAVNAFGHAFPDHAEPKVGATVAASPGRVRIWFDSALEPVFSGIKVQDQSGKGVDNQDGRVAPSDATLLEVSIPRLPAGSYRVFWSVVARDGHRTNGDYSFTVR